MLELARRHPAGPPYSHAEYLATIRKYLDKPRPRAQRAASPASSGNRAGVGRSSKRRRATGPGAVRTTFSPGSARSGDAPVSSRNDRSIPHAWLRAAVRPLDRELAALCTRRGSFPSCARSTHHQRTKQCAARRFDVSPNWRRPRVGPPSWRSCAARCPACPPPRCFTSPIERCLRSSGSGSASSNAPRPTNTARARHNGFSGTALPWSGVRVARFYARNRRTLSVAAEAAVLAHLSRVDPAAATQGSARGVVAVWPVEGESDETLLDFVASLDVADRD